MKKNIKKYFVTILALLLVLSNFSFAASYVYCNMKMNKAGFTSCCQENNIENENEGNNIVQGLTIDTKDNTCCKTGVKELVNTNTLLSFDIQIKHNLTSLADGINTSPTSFKNNPPASKFIYFGDRIPPPDIRIITSSFLI